MNMTGLDNVFAELDRYEQAIRLDIMRRAVQEGAKVVENSVTTLAPVNDGALRASVRIEQAEKSEQYGWIRWHVKAGNKTAWYAHLVEYGTGNYYNGVGKSKGAYVVRPKKGTVLKTPFGYITKALHIGAKPNPFMRTAWDSTHQQAMNVIAQSVRMQLVSL